MTRMYRWSTHLLYQWGLPRTVDDRRILLLAQYMRRHRVNLPAGDGSQFELLVCTGRTILNVEIDGAIRRFCLGDASALRRSE